LALIVAFMAREVVAGILAHSLALLSDAAHMLTDAGARSGSPWSPSRWLHVRPAVISPTASSAAEILSAQANGAMLLVLAALIVYEGIHRLVTPPAVGGWTVLLVALAGVVVNLLATWQLAKANRENMAVEGAEEIGRAIAAHEHVDSVHDLHVWEIASGFPALSAHVLVPPGDDCHGVRRELEQMIDQRFGIDHTTLQVDHARSNQLVTIREPARPNESEQPERH
jgi:Co/Zn/Cd efflux system component